MADSIYLDPDKAKAISKGFKNATGSKEDDPENDEPSEASKMLAGMASSASDAVDYLMGNSKKKK